MRSEMRFAAFALALLTTAGACVASPALGKCMIHSTAGDREASKTCSQCQWECLTDPLHCTGLAFDGQEVAFDALPTWSCGDNKWTSASPGLCVLFDTAGNVFDTQEQDCTACLQQCKWDARCTSTVYNYVPYAKDATSCECRARSPPPSCARHAPSRVLPRGCRLGWVSGAEVASLCLGQLCRLQRGPLGHGRRP
jgi:hypothetical protein